MKLATGPVTWGVDFADGPGNPPWQTVLDEIAASSVHALELGPVGYLPEDPALVRDALGSRGLDAVGSFVFDDLHDPARAEEVLEVARRATRMIAGAGGSVLVIIDRPSAARVKTAGNSALAPRLPGAEWRQMLGLIGYMAEVARAAGLTPVVHPHVGGFLEFEDEIERLLSDTDLDLCLDTGHLLYAGLLPEELIATCSDRLAHMHLKDVDGAVLADVRSRGSDFWTAIAAGIFCPVGDGEVNLPAVLRALERIGYAGYATIEQDRVPGTGSPKDDLEASVAVIARASAGDAGLSEGSRR